ncbi:MAG: TIM barrel protein [Planctomycetota bacterium]|jgi:hydroxypyruvate isomerase
MEQSTSLDRRSFLATTAIAAGGLALPAASIVAQGEGKTPAGEGKVKLRQSVARWIYNDIPLEKFCEQVAAMGITGVDLLTANEWQVPKKFGLQCSMAFGPKSMQIGHGLNRLMHHDEFVKESESFLPRIGDAGIRNMIVFSGNRGGMDDKEGIQNCITGLRRLAPLAEKAKVTLCLEYLNSKVDHHDYAFDKMSYGLDVCKAVNSPNVKILYDIYHAQIMEGDVIRTLTDNSKWIGHYHTGGVPGRADIDDTQELNYPAICRAILATGYDGFVAHEFIPKKDAMTTLARCTKICDV